VIFLYNDNKYYERLVNKLYRLLPIYEGRDKDSGDFVCAPEIAYINYLNNLTTVGTELEGWLSQCPDEESRVGLRELISLIYGMEKTQIGEHGKVKTNVFAAIRKAKHIGGIA
jgi:hypothetical protein